MSKHKLKKGQVLTYEEEDESTTEGKKITVKPIRKWLLE